MDWAIDRERERQSVRHSGMSMSIKRPSEPVLDNGGGMNLVSIGENETFHDEESPAMMDPLDNSEPVRSIHHAHHKAGRRDIDFLLDDPTQMTYGRRIAMALMKYSFYYPKRGGGDNDNNIESTASRIARRYTDYKEEEATDSSAADPKSSLKRSKRSRKRGESHSPPPTPPQDNNNNFEPSPLIPQRKQFMTAPALQEKDNLQTVDLSTSLGGSSKARRRRTDNGQNPDSLPPLPPTPQPSAHSHHHRHSTKHVPQKASLAKAWAYFEHVTLPRHIDTHEHKKKSKRVHKSIWTRCYRRLFAKGNESLERADPGEMHRPTKLYSPLFTPISQMGDFGLGTGLYFTTLRAMTIITFLLGVINIPNMMYFRSKEYGNGQEKLPLLLQGSAICTKQAWVPCPTCTMNQFSDNLDRLANITIPTSNNNNVNRTLVFALRNQCDGATFQVARVNFATVVFLVMGLVALQFYQRKAEQAFDDDEETAQDYSIVVKNPPHDAVEPDEWRDYFQDTFNARVAVVTVGLDNDLLVKTLVERREVLRQLELLLEPGASLDVLSLARLSTSIERKRNALDKFYRLFVPGIPEFFGRLTVLTSKVQGLAQQEHEVRNVFVTFEREKNRVRVLNEFALGSLVYWGCLRRQIRNKGHLRFMGRLLLVGQPDEPATIRWQDLNSKFRVRLVEMTITNIISCVFMALIAYVISRAYQINDVVGAGVISIFNLVFPEVAKFLTDAESHFSEGDKQTSLYFKIALFRWVNTAIVITIITVSFACVCVCVCVCVRARNNGIVPAEKRETNVLLRTTSHSRERWRMPTG